MASFDLDKDLPPPNTKVVLDSSALIALAQLDLSTAKKDAIPPREVRRGERVRDFVRRAIPTGVRICATPLALEELAAVVRRTVRASEAKSAHRYSWDEFVKAEPPATVEAAGLKVQLAMLDMMARAANQVGALKIEWEVPPVEPGSVGPAAVKLRKAHRMLLQQYPRLDPMDALHIAVGAAMESLSFVTLDGAWREVANIAVYG